MLAAVLLLAAPAFAQLHPLPPQAESTPYPTNDWPVGPLPDALDRGRFDANVDSTFARIGRGGLPDTRALLVVRGGRIVFERYAEGFDRDSRFHSWSMAKSFTNALVGIAVREGWMDPSAPPGIAAWKGLDDARREITLTHLLHMTSGLDNADGQGQSADGFASRMLFGEEAHDMAAFAGSAPLVHPPGTHWEYSTATSVLLAALVQSKAGPGRDEMLDFMRRELFEPLGMRSATPEFDGIGRFVGGAHMHCSARDYARFGLLYLRDGVWEGRRILPEGWVDFTRTLAPASNNGNYAAHFWLSHTPAPGQFASLVGAPPSTFSANGNDGQFIAIVPSHDLVLVRLGILQASTWAQLMRELVELIQAFPEVEGEAG